MASRGGAACGSAPDAGSVVCRKEHKLKSRRRLQRHSAPRLYHQTRPHDPHKCARVRAARTFAHKRQQTITTRGKARLNAARPRSQARARVTHHNRRRPHASTSTKPAARRRSVVVGGRARLGVAAALHVEQVAVAGTPRELLVADLGVREVRGRVAVVHLADELLGRDKQHDADAAEADVAPQLPGACESPQQRRSGVPG